MRVGLLCLELGGPNKGSRRKTKVLGKELIPFITWEKLLVGRGGLGIFVFSARDPGEEGTALLLEGSSLDTGALEEERPSIQGPEIMVEPQGMSHEDVMDRLR